jgi:hypothetical protein
LKGGDERKMKAFYGSKISENMTKTPEGFLICFNVPIARTGWYEYLASEVGLQGNNIVKVYRSPEEVFDKKAIASFEGKIVTDNHPPELLTPDTSGLYIRGAMQNVRQSPNEPDLLLADLMVYNKGLIDEIENKGKREVSCGYEYILVPNDDGTYSQTNIVGNHVAVVDSGRAGDRVAIMDSKIQKMEGEKKRMSKVRIPRTTNSPISYFFQSFGLKHYAQDAEPEEFAEAVDALTEERAGEMRTPEKIKDAEVESSAEQEKEDQGMATLSAKVDQCMQMCQQVMEMMKGSKEEKPEDAIDNLISELSEGENSTGDEEESMTIPVEEMDEDIPDGHVVAPEDRPENPIQGADSAATVRALKTIKKVIASIPDAKTRKIACDSIMAEYKKANKPNRKLNGYAKIMQAQKQNALSQQQATDSAADKAAKLEAAHKAKNPHYKGEK